MKKEEFFLKSNDNKTDLHVIAWIPETEIRGVLQLTHGMVEYIDRYHDFAVFMADHGFAVIGHDHLGHGRSVTDSDKLGFFCDKNGHAIVIEDIFKITQEAHMRWPEKRLFILGHSMGSFMTRRYLALHASSVNGAIIMGTGFVPAGLAGLGPFLSVLTALFRGPFYRSKLLTGLALGGNNKAFEPARTPNDWLSRNTENVDRYQADPLCGFMFTASAYKDFFKVIGLVAKEDCFEDLPSSLALLITSGEKDPVGGKAACPKVKAVYDRYGIHDVTIRLYPDDRHEILNEVDRDVVYEDILTWINAHM